MTDLKSQPDYIELPAEERGLSPQEEDRYDRAIAELNSKRHPLTEKQRGERKRAIARIEAARREAIENTALAKRLEETVALAQGRGEATERSSSGAIRIDRDPILALIRRQQLTPDQFDAAVECRIMYEARGSDLSGSEYSDAGGTAHDHEAFVAKRVQRAKALNRIGVIEREIALKCAQEQPAALQMLRFVVGEGKALSSMGEGRAYYRHLEALQRALDIAAAIICGKG